MSETGFSPTIGVFDSGLGGLTALRQLRALAPGCDIVYFGDTARVPYGTRDAETLVRFARQDVEFLRSQGAQQVLVACGTISSALSADQWAALPLPCQGVIEAAVAAALAATQNGRIGILATPASIRSGSYVRRLAALRPEVLAVPVACPDFVPLIESGRADAPQMRLAAREYLRPILEAGCDTLILGCTHYPLAAPLLTEETGGRMRLIDSGKEAAAALLRQLPAVPAERSGSLRCFVSGDPAAFAQNARTLLGDSLVLPAVRQAQAF